MSFDTTQPSHLQLRNILKERSDRVVAWIGSGLSVPAGLPKWPELRDKLRDKLHNIAVNTPDEEERLALQSRCSDVDAEMNLWHSFSILKSALQRTSYRSAIRGALQNAAVATIPKAYKKLWSVGVTGIVSLNLDPLAHRAHSEVFPGKMIHPFTGDAMARNVHVLKSQHNWLLQLHGSIEDEKSWVFTARELRWLQGTSAYTKFIDSVLTSRTVLFIGVTVDDIAVGGHLERLANLDIDTGGHFWLTDRADPNLRNWAESVGVEMIRYSTPDGTHKEVDEFFEDISAHVPVDVDPKPVRPQNVIAITDDLPLPEELERESAENIRSVLNAHAARILQSDTEEAYEAYEEFCRSYREAIYRAWFVDTEPPKNDLLSYRLLNKVDEGAFGQVYRAEDRAGNTVALKLLHGRILRQPEMLQSFRRGVGSMRILSKRDVPGVVPYLDASEIPTFVVMEFVEGMDLEDAVREGVLESWTDVLRVGRELVTIVRRSHRLPERVLHRDIRPSNVMLRNCWARRPQWDDVEVVVLDFDLSWHVNAHGLSVSQPGQMNGFMAPEQADRERGVSTRNAAVDSYGTGMTLMFIRSGHTPAFGEHLHGRWDVRLQQFASQFPHSSWVSLPRRFFRLVDWATRDEQRDRWDMAAIEGELERLSEADADPAKIKSAELIAEELLARASHGQYEWIVEQECGEYRNPSGVAVRMWAKETAGAMKMSATWLESGTGEHRRIRKWLPDANNKVQRILRSAGFTGVKGSISTGKLVIEGDLAVNDAVRNIESVGNALQEAFEVLQFR